MKTYLLAPDSFKDSMSAKIACEAMEKGIKKIDEKTICIHAPMADGGEGTVEALITSTNGRLFEVEVIGPEQTKVNAVWGLINDTTAVVEVANCSGIQLIEQDKRNPMVMTSYGLGMVIKETLNYNIKKLIIGLGGSGCNDGGCGMLQALGVKLLKNNNVNNSVNSSRKTWEYFEEIKLGAEEIDKIVKIDLTNLDPRIKDVEIEIACDVNNPFVGLNGASFVFGPQKGANYEMCCLLDAKLVHFANIIKQQLNIDIKEIPGSGAAGGLGGALIAFLNGKIIPGIELVIKYSDLETKCQKADYIFTGEGKIDFQTKFGKTPYGVAKMAKKFNKPVIAFAGSIGKDIEILYDYIDAIIAINPQLTSLEYALANGEKNLEQTVENIVRILKK